MLGMKIAIVGAGPAGIMAAIQVSCGQNEVVLFEQNSRIGKKLLVTGSGRCNLTNANLSPQRYTAEAGWMQTFLESFDLPRMEQALLELGIALFHTGDSWYYPLSESAQSVVVLLETQLRNHNVLLRIATKVSDIRLENKSKKGGGGFLISYEDDHGLQRENFDYVVIATGGCAYPELGSRGELFPLLALLGHRITPIAPALGPIYANLGAFKALQGQRFDVRTQIMEKGKVLGQSIGNVIVIDKGFNGPGIMNLSHLVSSNPDRKLQLRLSFPALESPALHTLAKQPGQTVSSLLNAFFNPKATQTLLKIAGIAAGTELNGQKHSLLDRLLKACELNFEVTGAGGFNRSQASAGGVCLAEVDPRTMQSRLIPGLYLVGETLDVVGECGGYNLHFAFGSGYLAGKYLASE